MLIAQLGQLVSFVSGFRPVVVRKIVIRPASVTYHPAPAGYRYLKRRAVVEIRAITEAVLDDKPIPVTGGESRIPVVMALAAGKSSHEHRPVRISEIAA